MSTLPTREAAQTALDEATPFPPNPDEIVVWGHTVLPLLRAYADGRLIDRDAAVGTAEIAKMLVTWPPTVSTWRRDGVIPKADIELKCGPVWDGPKIVEWAKETGRWPHDEEAVT